MKLFGIISVCFDVTDTTDQIFCIHQILNQNWEYNERIHQLFTNLKNAYDSVRREVLYNILVEFGVSMKLIRLIKMYLNEMYSKVHINKHLSNSFPSQNGLKQGDALSRLIFNFTLKYAIRRVKENQVGLKLNGTHQLLAYADDMNLLGETQIDASEEISLEINVEKLNICCYLVIRMHIKIEI
jgi:hypothetical protein